VDNPFKPFRTLHYTPPVNYQQIVIKKYISNLLAINLIRQFNFCEQDQVFTLIFAIRKNQKGDFMLVSNKRSTSRLVNEQNMHFYGSY